MKKLNLWSLLGLFVGVITLSTLSACSDDDDAPVSPVVGEWACQQSFIGDGLTLTFAKGNQAQVVITETYNDEPQAKGTRATVTQEYVKIDGTYSYNEKSSQLVLTGQKIAIFDDDNNKWTTYTWKEFVTELNKRRSEPELKAEAKVIKAITRTDVAVEEDESSLDEQVEQALETGVLTLTLNWVSDTHVTTSLFGVVDLDFYKDGSMPEEVIYK